MAHANFLLQLTLGVVQLGIELLNLKLKFVE
jgi:hypothetical protein